MHAISVPIKMYHNTNLTFEINKSVFRFTWFIKLVYFTICFSKLYFIYLWIMFILCKVTYIVNLDE